MGRIPINAAALAIETLGLSKFYRDVKSLADCNLQVRAGQVYGLLGPNGAGKTTLIRTLLGFIRPTSGQARVCGFDILTESLRVREQVSYLPADARLYRSMRGSQVLELFAGLHRFGDLQLSREVARRLELDVSRRVMFMSTGMRQKLAIAVVLGCNSPLVVLDEPTANLDPNVRGEVLQLIREIRQRGNTVLLSSHIFSDIDEACDRVGIIRGGKLVAEQEIAALQQLHIVNLKCLAGDAIPSEPGKPSFLQWIEAREQLVTLHLSGPAARWLGWLAEQPWEVLSIEKAGIETIYNRVAHGPVN